MKKIISLLLVVALTATVAVGGTLAYLTQDVGDEENVFTVGAIDLSLDEEVAVIGEGGEVTKDEDGAEYTKIMPGDFLQKEVTVKNEGKMPAYVAITVKLNNADKINASIDDHYEPLGWTAEQVQAKYDEIFAGWGINYNPRPGTYGSDARGVIDGTYGLPENVLHVDFAKTISGSTVIGAGNWFTAGKEKPGQYWVDGPADYDGYYTKDMNDYEICYTYYAYLGADESTTLFKGLNVPAEFDADQLAMFDNLKIDISASAIQADNIPVADKYVGDTNGEAKTAFALLAEQMEVAEGVSIDATVSSVEELEAAIADGAEVIWLNDGTYNPGNGTQRKTLTLMGDKGAVLTIANEGEGGMDYGFDGSNITFKGVTIKTGDSCYSGYARMTATFENCTIEGTFNLSSGNKVFNNCTFNKSGNEYNVWTWGVGNASFNDCTFNCDGKSILVYNQSCDIDFTNCVFNDNGTIGEKAAIETGVDGVGPKYNINLTNCVINGFDVNPKGAAYENIVGNKNSLTEEYLNVVIDGVDVY